MNSYEFHLGTPSQGCYLVSKYLLISDRTEYRGRRWGYRARTGDRAAMKGAGQQSVRGDRTYKSAGSLC